MADGRTPTPRSGDSRSPRDRSIALRSALLALHKTLIDTERVEFERTMGEIQSPTHFLQLLTTDPWFAWLHPLSRLIVAIDEVLEQPEPISGGPFEELMRQAGSLLAPSESGEGFSGHYYMAMQRDPDVVLAHATAVRTIAPRA